MALCCRRQNSEHMNAALGETRTAIRAHRLRRRLAAGAILILCLRLQLHGLHAVAHRIFGEHRCCDTRAHLHIRPRRGNRRKRQREGDQDRKYAAQSVQGEGSFQMLNYHECPYQTVKTRNGVAAPRSPLPPTAMSAAEKCRSRRGHINFRRVVALLDDDHLPLVVSSSEADLGWCNDRALFSTKCSLFISLKSWNDVLNFKARQKITLRRQCGASTTCATIRNDRVASFAMRMPVATNGDLVDSRRTERD